MLVKIESITADVLLIYTNVARTYIAWINIIITVEICQRWSNIPNCILVKLGFVTAEIFLIWTDVTRTNVARTNVAWTNVNLIVGFCSIYFQEATFEVSSKSQIWTNVAKTIVAWANVTMTVGICSLDVPRNLQLKFDQNWANKS